MEQKRESVILIPVPEAESAVQKLREKYDRVSLHGVPAHITILFPFRHPEVIDETVLQQLKFYFSNVKPFAFSLNEIATFPDTVFLKPNPTHPFVGIVENLVKIFPDTLPYEGRYPINPHLTIAQLKTNQSLDVVRDDISAQIISRLPIMTAAHEAWILASTNGEWSVREKFPFAV